MTRLVGEDLWDRSADLRGAGVSLAALPDGSVWHTVRLPDRRASVVKTTDGATWEDVATEGLEALLGPGIAGHTFAQTQDGRVWLGFDRGERGGGLAVLEDAGWRVLDAVPGSRGLRIRSLEPDSDGSLWALADFGAPGDGARHVLVHVDEDRIEVLGEAEGMPQATSLAWTGWSPLEPSALAIDDSGRVWFSAGDIGLWSYDGVTFDRLEAPRLRRGALDLERAPDGSIWVVSRTGRLYRLDGTSRP